MIIYKVSSLSPSCVPQSPTPLFLAPPFNPSSTIAPPSLPVDHTILTHILFQDIITGDEIISDTYELKEIDGVAYEADCRRITVGNDNIGVFLGYPSPLYLPL